MRYAAIILLGGALSIADTAESKKSAPNLAALPAPVAGPVDYAKDIQPIFAKHCYPCHGPEKHKSGLRLDCGADALRGGDSGAVIVPGKSAESVLIHNVAGLDPDYVMPPEGEGDRLARGEIAKLRAWIDRGAVWPKEADGYATRAVNHWAFKAAPSAELAERGQRPMAAQSDRHLRAGPPGAGEDQTVARGGPRHADPPPLVRSARAAADPRRT